MKVQQNERGEWQVVKGAEVLGTFATIKAAMDARFELRTVKAPKTLYFKADGTEVTRRPRRRAA